MYHAYTKHIPCIYYTHQVLHGDPAEEGGTIDAPIEEQAGCIGVQPLAHRVAALGT